MRPRVKPDTRAPRLSFIGDSDAHIVRGLIAILFALYSGKTADAILDIDANAVLSQLHLKEHLTPQRSNGLLSMVERIRKDARERASRTRPRFTDRRCLATHRASAGSLRFPNGESAFDAGASPPAHQARNVAQAG